MINQVIVVGRIYDLQKKDNGVNMTLAVQRAFKNEEGVYDTDFVPVVIYGIVADNTLEYCKKGDLVGIKGRIESTSTVINVIADKVTFLSSTQN